MERRNWERAEQLLALRLYCILPFGQLHRNNEEINTVANAIGRTPSAVAMKACNFASLDPTTSQKGLGHVSSSDRSLWQSFVNDSQSISIAAEEIFQELITPKLKAIGESLLVTPKGPTCSGLIKLEGSIAYN